MRRTRQRPTTAFWGLLEVSAGPCNARGNSACRQLVNSLNLSTQEPKQSQLHESIIVLVWIRRCRSPDGCVSSEPLGWAVPLSCCINLLWHDSLCGCPPWDLRPRYRWFFLCARDYYAESRRLQNQSQHKERLENDKCAPMASTTNHCDAYKHIIYFSTFLSWPRRRIPRLIRNLASRRTICPSPQNESFLYISLAFFAR